jgi:sugar phosphate isomerase/epimerase
MWIILEGLRGGGHKVDAGPGFVKPLSRHAADLLDLLEDFCVQAKILSDPGHLAFAGQRAAVTIRRRQERQLIKRLHAMDDPVPFSLLNPSDGNSPVSR